MRLKKTSQQGKEIVKKKEYKTAALYQGNPK
jgi:hypothetical protein